MRLPKLLLAAACACFAAACGDATNTPQTANTGSRPTGAATPTAARAEATPDELAAARGIYAATCQKCHRPDGSGGPVEDEAGGKPIKAASLREGHARTHTDEQLARTISNGEPDEGMPAFKTRLSPEQIQQLVRFIRKEFQGQTGAAGAAPNTNAPAAAR